MSDIADQGPVWSLIDCTVEVPSGSSLVDVDLLYARTVAVDPQITTLTFEGNDTSEDIDEPTKWNLTVTCDKNDFDAIQRIFGKTAVTGQPGEDWRMYMGDDAETAGATVGLRYTLKYKDQSQTPAEVTEIGYRFPRGTVKIVRPQSAEWKAKNIMQLQFTMEKTTTDAANQALPSVPANGAPYYIYRNS